MGKKPKEEMLILGPNKILVKRRFASDKLNYYDKRGHKISEEAIRRLIAWLESAPVDTEFLRKTSVSAKIEFLDNAVRDVMNHELYHKEYHAAYETLCMHCQDNPSDLTIKMSSYVKRDGRYDAVSFLFEGEERTHMYKVSYDSNDYTREPTVITEATYEEFEAFCKEKFERNNVFIPNENRFI